MGGCFLGKKNNFELPAKELTRKPKRIVVKNIIKFSQSNNFNDAREEWELLGPIGSDSREFVDHCDICNAMLYKENWIIKNTITKKIIKVGSDCIRRFIILSGTGGQAETIQYMDNIEKEWSIIKELRLSYKSIIKGNEPKARDLNRFHRKLTQLLRNRGQYPLSSDFSIDRDLPPILKSVFGFEELPPLTEQWKVYQILHDPSKVKTKKETRKFRDKKYKEGQTFQRKGKVTATTLSSSGAYRPDEKYK